uniref:Uncharacterized protein n=1 Tax=Caenorhabditis japonica TaxID=281687 RepID=A0A8R1ED75_CAEJA
MLLLPQRKEKKRQTNVFGVKKETKNGGTVPLHPGKGEYCMEEEEEKEERPTDRPSFFFSLFYLWCTGTYFDLGAWQFKE